MKAMKLSHIPNPFGGPVYRFEAVESTMLEAARLSDDGRAPHGTVVMADFQGAGQGRVTGRRWESPPGESLMFTLVLESTAAGSPLKVPYSLLAGLAVCRAVEAYAPGARVKWPNDVLLGGRKCAGILTRTRGGFIHIGIGINCLQRGFSGTFNYRPASIFEASGRLVRPVELLPPLLDEMHSLLNGGWDLSAFSGVLYGQGERCRVRTGLPGGGREVDGIIAGIGGRGELLLESAGTDKILEIDAGEIIALTPGRE